MKPLSKHKFTFPFVRGTEVADVTKMPSYSSSGLKTYKRILPPVRNNKVINISVLYTVLTEMLPLASCQALKNGILINNNLVIINEGIATAHKTRFRFTNLADLLGNLCQLNILPSNFDVPHARDKYYKSFIKHEY